MNLSQRIDGAKKMVDVEITYIIDYVQGILSKPISIQNPSVTWGMFLTFVIIMLVIAWALGQGK